MKDKVLKELNNKYSGFVSGERLGSLFNVSRTAVWKYIKELKNEGYVIEASPNKGYRLVSSPDNLRPYEISLGLKTKIIGKDIKYFYTIDSTNDYAKKLASMGCHDGTVIVAESQTCGRGRLGRLWYSGAGKGIWMSVVLKPQIALLDIQIVTLAASVAVCFAIEEVTGIKTGIKWPNDIILSGKKVCGILTETNSEMELINFLVIGVGINVHQEIDDFPDELREKAISLKMHFVNSGNNISLKRSDIIKSFLFKLEQLYNIINAGEKQEIIDQWKKYSITLGKSVKVVRKKHEYTGTAEDITIDGKLVIRCSDGVVREVISGEVSINSIKEAI